MNSFEQGFMDKLAELRKEAGIKQTAVDFIKRFGNKKKWMDAAVKPGSKKTVNAMKGTAEKLTSRTKNLLGDNAYNKIVARSAAKKGTKPVFNSSANYQKGWSQGDRGSLLMKSEDMLSAARRAKDSKSYSLMRRGR